MRLLIKVGFYIVFWTVATGILQGILFDNWFGTFLSTVIALAIGIWLEVSGTSNKIIGTLLKPKQSFEQAVNEFANEAGQGAATPMGVETSMDCPNCGAQVKLIGGHGKCRACDTAF